MRSYWWLIPIFILALALRVIGLNNNPPGFTPDEAAFGYNAYSLLKTGKDEWGVPFYKLPLTNLESFGDYKLPLYAFLAVPTVKLFGLNEFATRLPNAIFGSLMVLAVFALAKKASKLDIGLYAAFVAAVSPWSIQMSRGAFEANLVTFLLPFSIALLLSRKYLLSGLILVLNFYSYHSARFLSILLLIFLLIKFPKRILLNFLILLLFLPGLLALFGAGGRRSSDVSILSPTDSWQSVADRRFEAVQTGLPDVIARIFSNKATAVITQFSKNYLSYLSLDFLFTQGAKESTYGMIPGMGVLYSVEVLFLSAAIIFLVKHQSLSKRSVFFIVLFLVSFVPAALSKGPGLAANRAVAMLPFLLIFIAFGIATLSRYFPKFLLPLFYSLSLLLFLETYYYHNGDLYHGMLYGRREAFTRIANLAKDYDHIYVSTSLSEPHIYVAFFNQIDPIIYQKYSSGWQQFQLDNLKFLDQLPQYSLGKYTFGRLNFQTSHSLYAGLPQDFPSSIKPMFTIDYPDAAPAVVVSRL